METLVTLTLAAIVAFAIIMYVFLDGFDLGIGIMFPWIQTEHERNMLVSSILPVWDGNETWLVLGGAALYGAFPMVYSYVLPTLYIPIFMMLGGLIFRGVSFEFMHYSHKSRFIWTFCFSLGSLVAAFSQGIVLGTFVQGFDFENGKMVVATYHWLTPFSMMTGIAVVFGYALLGATWSVLKTTGKLQQDMVHRAKILLLIVGLFMLLVSVTTPLVDPQVFHFWFHLPNSFFLMLLPLATLATFIVIWRALNSGNDTKPFYLSFLLFLFPYLGFALSVWPYIIPRHVTIWEAAAPYKAQVFILVGLLAILPILITYTIYAYVVFKGKVTEEGLHV